MAVNRVDFGGNTLIDLTGDTLESAEQLLEGVTAHGRDGTQIAGNIPDNGDVSTTMDGVSVKSVSIPSGRTSGGTVGLDSTIDNAVSAAITALIGKGVSVPDGANVVDLASLIESIETGVAVQTATGTFKTNSSGIATVECGFQPDVIVITKNETNTESGTTYTYATAIPFSDFSSKNLTVPMWTTNSSAYIYDFYPTRSTTGFTIEVYKWNSKWSQSTVTNTSFTYIAYKFT